MVHDALCDPRHTSNLTHNTQHTTPHTHYLTHNTSQHLTPHTSHTTPHTSHLTPHTSHLTPHTSHLTPHRQRCIRKLLRQRRNNARILAPHARLRTPGVFISCCCLWRVSSCDRGGRGRSPVGTSRSLFLIALLLISAQMILYADLNTTQNPFCFWLVNDVVCRFMTRAPFGGQLLSSSKACDS